MLSTAVQILAFALALLGVVGSAVATLLPNWKVSSSSWSSLVAPVWRMQGLWVDCVCYASAAFSCTLKPSLLALPASLLTTRAAMLLCCVLGLLGLCLASLGLKCTRWGGSRRAKGHTAVAAGACLVLASVLCLLPASWFTKQVMGEFLSTDLPESRRFQPGGALCLTFISAGFLLAGGVMLCMSCPGRGSSRPAADSSADPRDGVPVQQRERRRPELQTEPRREERMSGGLVQKKPEQPPPRLAPKDVKDSYSRQEYV